MLKMGVAKRDITPGLDVPHAGWGAQAHVFADGIEAEHYVTAMVLSDGISWSVILDLDATEFTSEQTDQLREAVANSTSIAVPHIRLAVSHTHASPLVWGNYYPEAYEASLRYMRHVLDQTVSAAQEAKSAMVGVTVSAGFGHCSIGINRRQTLEDGRIVVGVNHLGASDPRVGVVRFEDEDNRLVAMIVQYACHPTTLGFTNRLHSPDYPGVMRQFVERNLGGICLFLQGSAGNIGPGPEGFKDNIAAMRRIGMTLGAAVVKVALEIEANLFVPHFEGVVESGAPLGIWSSVRTVGDTELLVTNVKIPIPLKPQVSPQEALIVYTGYKTTLAALRRDHASTTDIQEMTYHVKRAYLKLLCSEQYYGKETAEIETHFTRIGDIVLIGAQIEPFVEIGMKIRELSPFSVTLFGGYSNGVMGYLPVAEAYDEGGYEVDFTPYASEAAEDYIRQVEQILQGLQ